MPTDVPDPATELQAIELDAIERAREGEHDAFVRLYRQDAPPAWRLGLALTGDALSAADAVALGFARVLVPSGPGARRSEVPFRLRLLTATRHVVLDQGTGHPRRGAAPELGSRRAEVMHAFHQLPERWRTVLWLPAIEGIDLDDTARVLGIDAEGAPDLAARADAGLRTQWQRDRSAAGQDVPAAPEHLSRLLQSVLPLPMDLFDEVEALWRGERERRVGPVGLVLPGGRPVPRWAERGLLAGTAALIAAGITSALVVDRDPDVRRARDGELAEAPTDTSSALGATPAPKEPQAYLDGEDGTGGRIEPMIAAVQAAASARATGDRISGAAAGAATPTASDTDRPSPPTRPRRRAPRSSPSSRSPPASARPSRSASAIGAPGSAWAARSSAARRTRTPASPSRARSCRRSPSASPGGEPRRARLGPWSRRR